jgi:hypothetical protein
MGVLTFGGAIAAALVAGCYSPSLRDCTVSCASQQDCAGGQICGNDGLCASPDVAGRCAAVPDAGPDRDAGSSRDARPNDAMTSDAPAPISVRVQVAGRGSIVVDGRSVCSSQDVQHGDCTYDLAPYVAHSVHAVPIQLDQVFASWTSVTCSGQGASCVFTPVAATSIVAKFEHP